MSDLVHRILRGLGQLGPSPALRGRVQVLTGTVLQSAMETALKTPEEAQDLSSYTDPDDSGESQIQPLIRSVTALHRGVPDGPPDSGGAAVFVREGHRWSTGQVSTAIEELAGRIELITGEGLVVGSLAGFAGDAVLAAWKSGRAVTHRPSQIPAGRLLALLAGGQFAWIAVPATSLRAVLDHPALELEDYPELQAVFYDASGSTWLTETELRRAVSALSAEIDGRVATEKGMVSRATQQAREQAWATKIEQACTTYEGVAAAGAVLGVDGWRVYVSPTRRSSSGPSRDDASLATAVEEQLATEFDGPNLAASIEAFDGLGRIALSSMLHALHRCGVFRKRAVRHTEAEIFAGVPVAAAHRDLVRRWLRVLGDEGKLDFDGTSWGVVVPESSYTEASIDHAWAELSSQWQATTGATGTVDYARRSAAHLPELLQGKRAAVHLLFPEGRTEDARALYRENIAARYQHRAASRWLAELARRRDSSRPLRVLEIGGGTGATTESVLAELSGFDVDYVFTDVSRYFLDQAAPWLAKFPGVRLALYDIDRCPRAQGVAPASFDVVVSGGVLNAARDTDQTIAWLGQILRPGGFLVLTEPTREEYWVMASQAFMLVNAEDDRSESGATFLSHAQWLTVLERAGFHCLLDLPGPEHALARLGHRAFVAQVPTDRAELWPEDLAEKILQTSPSLRLGGIEVDAALPMDASGQPDRTQLQAWATRATKFELLDPKTMAAAGDTAQAGEPQ